MPGGPGSGRREVRGRRAREYLDLRETAAETPVRAESEGHVRVGTPVLGARLGVALDVEPVRLRKALRHVVRHRGRGHYRLAGFNPAARELERIGDGADQHRHGGIHPHGLERGAVQHFHLRDIGPGGLAGGEQGVGLRPCPRQEVGVAKQRVEHERAGARHSVEGDDERTEHGDLQVGFGEEARIRLVKVEELVDQIASIGPAVAPLARVAFDDGAKQLVHPRGGTAEPWGPVQEWIRDDVRQEEHTDEVDQLLVAGARRHSGGERSDLVGDDPLERGRHRKRRIRRPARNRTQRDVDEIRCMVLRESPGVHPLEDVAEHLVLGAFGAEHGARGAEARIEPAPVLVRAQVPRAVTLDEAVRLRAGENREPAVQQPDAVHRAELQVALRHETAHVPQQGEEIPGQRQASGGRDGRRSHGVALSRT